MVLAAQAPGASPLVAHDDPTRLSSRNAAVYAAINTAPEAANAGEVVM